jgi:hypothetical protein
MGFFQNILRTRNPDELKFKTALVESLDSPVKYSTIIQENNTERIWIVGKFKVNEQHFEYSIEIVKDTKSAYFMFHQFVNNTARYGVVNNLSTKEVLAVFSTIKEILFEYKDRIDQLEYEAADEKLLKFYKRLASYFTEFSHIQNGLNGILTRNRKNIIKTVFKSVKKGEN